MLSGPVLAQLFTAIVHVVVVLYIDRTTITTGHLNKVEHSIIPPFTLHV